MPDLAVPCSLEANLSAVRDRIARAAARVGRDPAAITLVAVTKTEPAERARELCEAGQVDLGESRAAGLEAKFEALADVSPAPRWHFVGHLQRNKLRRVLPHLHGLHSVDSAELVETLARARADGAALPELYVQLELGGAGGERTGLAPGALDGLLAAAAADRLPLAGLMTIAPLSTAGASDRAAGPDRARVAFRELARIARSLEARAETARLFTGGRVRLSMGMSDDFEVAIEEGSDLVRVGSALFAGLEDGARSSA